MPKQTKSKSRGRSRSTSGAGGRSHSTSGSRKTAKSKEELRPFEKGLKLRRLKIKNFKLFDEIELDFPPPRIEGDPDIVVLGSRNGGGKTTVLESCCLAFLAGTVGEDAELMTHPGRTPEYDRGQDINLADLMVRAGRERAQIQCSLHHGRQEVQIECGVSRNGNIQVHGRVPPSEDLPKKRDIMYPPRLMAIWRSLFGFSPEPFLFPPVFYFHSYRKVSEGNPELGMLVDSEAHYRRLRRYYSREPVMDTFKSEILRCMMGKSGLFDRFDSSEAETSLDQLTNLLTTYAACSIEKLRPSRENTIEFRVAPLDGTASFAFDGLSSGQKEIISTLFLVWLYTRGRPGLVLIDEPELHLNAEWHARFISDLRELAPDNQYIIATHSPDVAASVDADRRIMLEP